MATSSGDLEVVEEFGSKLMIEDEEEGGLVLAEIED